MYDRYQGCTSYTDDHLVRTRKEEAELWMLKDSINLDPAAGQLNVSYPCIKDPRFLKNNRKATVSMTSKLRQRLANNNKLDQYN